MGIDMVSKRRGTRAWNGVGRKKTIDFLETLQTSTGALGAPAPDPATS